MSYRKRAQTVSVQKVSDFLASLNMDEYISNFEKDEISGDVLIDLDSEGLSELQVDSNLHKLKILVGFRRFLKDGIVQFSSSKLIKALTKAKIPQYNDLLEKHGVDEGLLLYEDTVLVRSMLKDIGIASKVHIARILATCSRELYTVT